MLKAKESKGVGGGKRSKKSTHVRFFLPSSPPPPNLDDDDDDDDHADHAPSRSSSHYSPSLSSSTSSLRPPARAYPSPYSSSSSSSSSSQPPRRPPPIAPSSSSSSRPPHRPPPAAPSSSSSSSSSRVRLPPSSFSYLAPPSTTFGSSAPTSTASTTPRRGPPSTAFFAPPPSRPLLSTSSSSAASLPGSSSSASGMIGAGGWTRYRYAVDRASAAAAAPSPSSASTADRRPSPPPPRWRDDTDVSSSSSSSSSDDRTLTDATTNPSSSSAASPPPPSMSATEGETTTDGEITHPSLSSAMSSGVSSSSSSSSSSFGHSPVPSLSSPVSSPRAPAAASSTSPRRAPSPLASSSYQPPRFPRPASPAPIEPAPTSFACARPFGGVKDVDDVAAALEAWLIPPALSRGAATNKKKTKIRFGVEVGRLSQPRCSLRVSHLTGTEGRRARKWADVRSNTVAVSFAFAVKEGVNVFELGELSGSIKNLLLLVGSDELDTDLESKLVDEGPGTSKILLLNLLFRDECLFHAISAVLAHHRIEQADASLLLSQSPADCRSRRARLEGIDARLVVDAVIGRSILGFVEELVANLRREAVPPASAEQEDENENEEKERRRSERESEKRRGGGTRRHRATKEEKRRVAGAMLRKYGQQLLGIPPAAVAGLGDVDAITRLVHLLRALNDIRFFVEFDSLDELVRRLWPTPGTTDNGGDAGPRRSLSEEGELLGAAKKAKKKTKTKTKNETTEDAKRKKKTKEKKKKRLSGSASKRQSADTARHRRNSSSSSSRRRDAVDVGAGDDDSEAQQWESYSWHSLHAYLLASYDQLVRQTTAAAASVDGDGDGDDHDVDSGARPRDMGREIEEGIVASVRDMMLKLQSLSTIHSVRAIAGDDVLLVACEGMDLFAVLPSPDEMVAIERAAKSEARRRKKKNESEANKKTKKEEERRKKKKTTKETESGAVDGASVRSSAAAAVLSAPGIPGMPSRPLAPPKRDKVNIKLMVLGDLRVGKTSLIQRFLRGSAFTMPKYKPTYAADFVHKNVVLRDKPRTLQIWDTSGNERQRAPDRAFFKGVDALVLVFDQRRASTFAPALDRHLDDFLAHAACPDPRLLPVVVIGNRGCEKNESESEAAAGTTGKQSESESEGGEREVRRSEVEAWCRGRIEGNRLFAYFEASAKEGAHVDDAFLHAANAVLDVHHGAVH